MDNGIDLRIKRTGNFFQDHASGLVIGAGVVLLGSLLVIPGPWLAANFLAEGGRVLREGGSFRWQAVYERVGTFIPATALAILSSLAVAMGMAMCLIPGLLLSVAWLHAPALVAEGEGVLTAMGESWRLFTRPGAAAEQLLDACVLAALCFATVSTGFLSLLTVPLGAVYALMALEAARGRNPMAVPPAPITVP